MRPKSVRLYGLLAPLLVCVLVYGANLASAEQKLVYPGAIISVSGPSGAKGALSSNLTTVPASANFTKRPLGRGAIQISERALGTFSAMSTAETPEPYTRKKDLCKKAKTRRLLSQLGGRARCSANWAVFTTAAPNDSYASLQWSISNMRLSSAWDYTTGSTTNQALVLVIDTGVEYTHPDLVGNMWSNPREIAGNGIDDDRNGYVDDIHGINAINGTGNPLDDNGHGTHVAGIIAASGNNARGIAGVNWNAKIIGAKFLSATGSGSTANAIVALNYGIALKAAGHNVVVSNNSWGGGAFSSPLASAVSAANTAGILFVASAGNSASNNDTTATYPANYNYPNVISVASITSSATLSSFSNYGATTVDIAAPGSGIYSTYIGNAYASLSGTSMAAPQVSGVALLAQSLCGGRFTVAQMMNLLTSGASTNYSLTGLVSNRNSLDALGTVLAARTLCASLATATPTPTTAPAQPTTSPSTPTAMPTSVTAPTPTSTPVATAPAAPQPTSPPSPTATVTPTPTSTPTPLPTFTATPTQRPAPTATPTRAPTARATATPTRRATATPTRRPAATSTPRPTATPTRKPTATPTAKPTPTPIRYARATPIPTAAPGRAGTRNSRR